MTPDELERLHELAASTGLEEAEAAWAAALRQELVRAMPDAPPVIMRMMERPGWTTDILGQLRRSLDLQHFRSTAPDGEHERSGLPWGELDVVMREVAAASVSATLMAVVEALRQDAVNGAVNDHNTEVAVT
jgi:hypothetical protein